MASLIGNKPNQVSTNGDLGTLAFQDANAVKVTGGAITVDSAAITALTTTNDASISGLTVGKGGGAVASNTVIGNLALTSNLTGTANTALGYQAAYWVTGSNNTAVGNYSLSNQTSGATGSNNTAIGSSSLLNNTTASYNTAVGVSALQNNTTASNNTGIGYQAGITNSVGADNFFGGYQAGYSTTSNYNVIIGSSATTAASTGGSNVAIGFRAAQANTSGQLNVSVGRDALYTNSSGSSNVAVGYAALNSNTTASNNTAVGYQAGYSNTTGASNVFLGNLAGYTNSTGINNTAIGYQAGAVNTTSGYSTFAGYLSGSASTGANNTFYGALSGSAITTGTKNTIIGLYNGNSGGLDIRTASNYIVLADGDGNPRQWIDNSGYATFQNNSAANNQISLRTGDTASAINYLTFGTSTYNRAQIQVGGTALTDGYMAFFTESAGSNVERMRLPSTGGVQAVTTISVGNATPSTSGAGITVPATQSASTDANTLDDYEEGTWTPTIVGVTGASGQTYATQVGNYTKVGNLVTVSFVVTLSAAGTLTGTYAGIGSLPFTSKNASGYLSAGSISYWGALGASWISLNAIEVNVNTTFAYIYGRKLPVAAAAIDILPTADIGNATRIQGTLTYMTA